MQKKEKLFEQFPPVKTSEWMNKITADLKGADFSKKLVWKTDEGIEVNPFYRMEDIIDLPFIDSIPGRFPFLRGASTENNSWKIRQNISLDDYRAANRKALDILMRGTDSLGFILNDPASVNDENLSVLLKEIHFDAIEINFLCNGKAKEILQIIKDISDRRGYSAASVCGAIEADPLGRLMKNGKLCIDTAAGFDYLAGFTREAEHFPNLRTIHLDASCMTDAGADLVTELGVALSMASEYMSKLTDRGIAPDRAGSKIRFSFGLSSNYFGEIAKLRAARVLWSLVQKAYGIPEESISGMHIHCVTGHWNMTIYDPYVNMLRTQTEAMSAVLGGTESLTLVPFDAAFRRPDDFSERIARNQQLILKEEAHFDKVSDPAGGSYYIEKLTSLVADRAWKLFTEIEEKGGFLAALDSGFIFNRIKASADIKRKSISSRKTKLVGTNLYPNPAEHLIDKIKTDGSPEKPDNRLESFRAAEPFEIIRMNVERSGRKPKVFLLQVGNPLMRRARSQFCSDFFGCGGYTLIDNNGFETIDSGVKAANDSGAEIVVICSSDEEYASNVPEISGKLNKGVILVVAGNPACAEELKARGIENFIHIKSDVVASIGYFNKKLGIN